MQVLHWFNPLVWLAFYHIQADRELACDALVLTKIHAGESKIYGKIYGRTIVNLLEHFSRHRRVPSMTGILETKSQLRRRIKMISKFKKTSHTRGAGAMLLLAVLACFILTNAYVAKADFEFAEPVNIQRIIPVLQPGYDFISCLSYDGLEMYIYSGQGFDTNLRVLRRESEDDDWVPQEDLELSSTLPMTTAHPFLPMDLRSTSARTGLGATVAGIST